MLQDDIYIDDATEGSPGTPAEFDLSGDGPNGLTTDDEDLVEGSGTGSKYRPTCTSLHLLNVPQDGVQKISAEN